MFILLSNWAVLYWTGEPETENHTHNIFYKTMCYIQITLHIHSSSLKKRIYELH